MTQWTHTRTIDAPVDKVFRAVTDVQNFAETSEDVIRIEMLSEITSGVGTRFRETRRMGKREATTELEITEFVENDYVRFVSDAGGTIWDTVFKVVGVGGTTQVDVVMDARPYKLMARFVTPLIKGMIGKFMAKDLDGLKARCESDRSDA